MPIRLSIVIPFYNVEKYIAECLDSVYNQDIPEDEYEVICVNDASPDGSRDIVLEYQKKHPNLVFVEHEVNKKLGAARNTGRRIARGKYLWNADSDDMIATNCLGEILDKCEKNDLDVLLFGFFNLQNGQTTSADSPSWNEDAGVITGIDFWKQQGIPNQSGLGQIWTQVYKRAYLDSKHVWSPEINMGEDVPFTYASILLAGKMMACNASWYVYRVNQASLTGVLKKTPTPETIYEHCFVCPRHVAHILRQIPRKEKIVAESVRMSVRSLILPYTDYAKQKSDASPLRHLCRKHFLQNLFVFRILNSKQLREYLGFILS